MSSPGGLDMDGTLAVVEEAFRLWGQGGKLPPHLHALVTDGAFSPAGWFFALPEIDLIVVEHLSRQRVLRLLLRERRLTRR